MIAELAAWAGKVLLLGRADHQRVGRLGEAVALVKLYSAGYRGLRRNLRVGGGEIDLIAFRGATVCVVEVKSSYRAIVPALVRVGEKKRKQLIRLARRLARRPPFAGRTLRFDLVEVDFGKGPLDLPRVRLIENAFREESRAT